MRKVFSFVALCLVFAAITFVITCCGGSGRQLAVLLTAVLVFIFVFVGTNVHQHAVFLLKLNEGSSSLRLEACSGELMPVQPSLSPPGETVLSD